MLYPESSEVLVTNYRIKNKRFYISLMECNMIRIGWSYVKLKREPI
jgi:hypothetical protein